MRIKKLERVHKRDHFYLEETDACYYFGEYTPRAGYGHSPTNQAISNLKKSVTLVGTPQYHWKIESIRDYGALLNQAFDWGNPNVQDTTWVPVPPSKAKGSSEYDDRMLQVLYAMSSGRSLDIRDLVYQKNSTDSSHLAIGKRPSPQELSVNYEIDLTLSHPTPKTIAIVDDVLTAGAHFKAMQLVLNRHFPGVMTFGVFLARTERSG